MLVCAAVALVCRCSSAHDCASVHVDLHGTKLVTAFHLLGQLDESMGRQHVAGSDLVERFYCDEARLAETFESELRLFAAEQGIAGNVEVERVQGCILLLHSRPLSCALDSLYHFERLEGQWATDASGRRHDIFRASITMDRFAALPREAKLAYLAGAHVRFGRGQDAFAFANAQQKTLVVEQLLRDVGCTNVTLTRDSGRVPQTTIIRFTPTAEVAAWFAQHR